MFPPAPWPPSPCGDAVPPNKAPNGVETVLPSPERCGSALEGSADAGAEAATSSGRWRAVEETVCCAVDGLRFTMVLIWSRAAPSALACSTREAKSPSARLPEVWAGLARDAAQGGDSARGQADVETTREGTGRDAPPWAMGVT